MKVGICSSCKCVSTADICENCGSHVPLEELKPTEKQKRQKKVKKQAETLFEVTT